MMLAKQKTLETAACLREILLCVQNDKMVKTVKSDAIVIIRDGRHLGHLGDDNRTGTTETATSLREILHCVQNDKKGILVKNSRI